MRVRTAHVALLGAIALSGCASSKYARNPVWVGGGINELQQSACNCGGVETKKSFKERRKAEARAQVARNKGGDN